MKKSLGFYFLIFIFTCFILVCGIALGHYLKYNTNKNQIKNDKIVFKFEDLPENVKLKYVLREDVPELANYININSEEMPISNAPIEGTLEELKAQIKTLRTKNQMLYKDNVNLSDKNWAIAQDLQEEKKAVEEEKREFQSKSIATMNEAEQQHYKNVNDLTKRINDLQQESVRSTKKYETQIVNLENQIDKLNLQLQKKDTQIDEEVNVATQKQRINNSTLAEKNLYLVEQVKLLKEKLENQYNQNIANLKSKKDEISILKETINQKEAKLNILLMNNTEEIIKIEQKNSSALNELKLSIKNIQNKHREEMAHKNKEITDLMLNQKKELANIKQSYENQENKIKSENLAQEKDKKLVADTIASLQTEVQKHIKDKIALVNQLKNAEDKIKIIEVSKEEDYVKMLSKIRSSLSKDRTNTNKNIQELEDRILEAASIIDNLKIEKTSLQKELQDYKEKLSDRISKKELESNEEKHSQNYKFLNEKIANLEIEKNQIYDEAKKQIQNIKNSVTNEKQSLKNNEILLVSLKEEIKTLKEENKNIRQNTIKEIDANNSSKITSLKKSIQDLQTENTNLSQKLDNSIKNENNYKSDYENIKNELQKSASYVVKNEKESNSLKTINDNLAKQNEILKTKLISKDQENELLNKQTQQYIAENKSLEEKLSTSIKLNQTLKLEKNSFINDKNTTITNLHLAQEKLNKTNEIISKLKDENLALNTKNNDLQSKSNKELASIKDDFLNTKKALKSSEEKTNLLKTQNEKLQSDLDNLHVNLQTLKDENLALNTKNNDLQSQSSKELTGVKDDFLNTKKALKSSEEKVTLLKTQNEDLQKTLKDLKASLLNLKNENLELNTKNINLKSKTSKELVNAKDDFLDIKKALRSSEEKAILLKTQNEKLQSDLDNLHVNLQTLKDENLALNTKNSDLQSKANKELASMKDDFINTKKALQISEEKANLFKTQNEKLQSDLDNSNTNILALKDKMQNLTQENTSIKIANNTKSQNQSEDKLELALNDLRNRRAEIMALKSEILTLKEKNELLANQSETLKTIKSEEINNTKITLLSKENKDLQKSLKSLKADILSLKNENLALNAKNNDLQSNINKKSVTAKDDVLDIQKALKSSEEKVTLLKTQNENLLEQLKNTSNVTNTQTKKEQKPTKLVLKDSIQCDDMIKGTNNPSKVCEQRVDEFLNKYNASYFFEIVPIVDNGGFASLKTVENSNLKIAKSEIQRLTRLSNIGLGKDRAASGGKLVRNKFGDIARISYAVSNMDIPEKRGFVIHVYK